MKPKASSDEDRSKDRKRRSRSRKTGSGGASARAGRVKVPQAGRGQAPAPIPAWHGPVIPMTLNDRVLGIFRAYCRRSRLSQAELARRAGKDRQWLHRLLTDVKVCTLDMMGCICNCMRCDPSYLVAIAEDAPANRARR